MNGSDQEISYQWNVIQSSSKRIVLNMDITSKLFAMVSNVGFFQRDAILFFFVKQKSTKQ